MEQLIRGAMGDVKGRQILAFGGIQQRHPLNAVTVVVVAIVKHGNFV